MTSYLRPLSICLILGPLIYGAPAPAEIPDLTPFNIGFTSASIIPITSTTEKEEKTEKNSECVQKVITNIHQHLDDFGINFKNFSNIVKNQRNFAKMCTDYLSLKDTLKECEKPLGYIYKNGIIAFLEITCRLKKEAIVANHECIAEMEVSAFKSCQQACISQNYQGFDALADPKSLELRCFVSSCIARCINDQIRECGDSTSLGQVYNEIAGAQMLLGVEQIYGAGTKQTSSFVQSEKIPAACRRLIWRSVLAAGNFSSRPTIPPPTKDSSAPF